jgi:predicted transcriptional regulator
MLMDEDELYLHVGVELRKKREALGLSQKIIADALDLFPSSISHIEAGEQRIRLDTLYKICMLLKLEPRKILPKIVNVTNPPKFTMSIGGQLVSITRKEAKKSLRKLEGRLGKNSERES